MQRAITLAIATSLAVATVGLLALAVVASAEDKTPADRGNGLSLCDERYLDLADKVADEFGYQALGRNLVRDGLLGDRHQAVPITERRSCSEGDELHLMLHPPPPPPTETVYDSAVAAPAPAVATTGGMGCTGMEAESGTEGYSAVNESSGAYGCYQVIPSTAAAHGCDLSTPGGQDACAATICATEGPGAWAASGVSPC